MKRRGNKKSVRRNSTENLSFMATRWGKILTRVVAALAVTTLWAGISGNVERLTDFLVLGMIVFWFDVMLE